MKWLSRFRRDDGELSARLAQDRAERLLAESFRLLAQLCSKMADMVEAQRLQRSGFETQDKFLKRTDGQDSR
jgi:hypothetical protein